MEEIESQEEEAQPILRRPERQSNKPKNLEDYVLIAIEEGERLLLSINNEPMSFYEANESRDRYKHV